MRSSILTLLFLVSAIVLSHGQGEFYPKRWGRVYKYELRALPKSGLAEVDTLYTLAKREQNIPQIIKALIYQSKFALVLSEDAELLITRKLQEEIKASKPPLKNILESVLAELYWQYLKEHRHKYYERSKTEEKVNKDDFRTWDLDGLFLEIHTHFQNSIKNKDVLQNINVAILNDILIQAENSRLYRPTLYDLLAQNALDFYITSESSLTTFTSAFALEDSSYFRTFQNIPVFPNDSLSQKIQALKIFKELLSFHSNDKNPDAYVSVEIDRLQFLVNQGYFPYKRSLHKKALARLAAKYQEQPASAQANFELASIANSEGNDFTQGTISPNQFKKRDALAICKQVIGRFPNSEGGQKCQVLLSDILNQKLEVVTEKYLPTDKKSFIRIEYRNVDSLSFLAYRVSDDFNKRFFNSMNDSSRIAELSQMRPEAKWLIRLKNLNDYQEHSTEAVVPSLPTGRYIIFTHPNNAEVKISDGMIAFASAQVTNLVLIESTFQGHERLQVVDRNNGKPAEGADVLLTSRNSNYKDLNDHLISDKNGFVNPQSKTDYVNDVQATVTLTNDHAVFGEYYFQRYQERNKIRDRISAKAFLFTDRSIYRPGQTVFFKGILIKIKNDKSSILTNQYVEVILDDATGDEVGVLRLKTNQFGSFSGEFKLPPSGLTGEYTLSVDEDSEGDSKFYDNLNQFEYSQVEISVEEYKRPTFETSFKPVKETFKVNDTVTVKGTAIAFSGANLTGAKISYSVKREVQYPHWYYWTQHDYSSESEEITSGEGMTNDKGEFEIKFSAIPDEEVLPEDKPIFYYGISVDVTDINGETRSATTTVKVGYHTLIATITAPAVLDKKIKENSITLATENLNGQHVPTKGSIQIYKIKFPDVPVRPRPWNKTDLPILSMDEFQMLFPHDSYDDDREPEKTKRGKLMATIPFNTETSKEVKFTLDNTWELGSYIMELTTTDPAGNAITDLHRFKVIDLKSKNIADNQLLVFEIDKASYKPGDIARLKVGSASPDITITLDFEKDYQIYKTRLEHFSNNLKEIAIPITEDMADGFEIHYVGVNFNGFVEGRKSIPVIIEREKIEIEIITFKDKLQPGEKQTWSFEIKGSDPMKKEAEVLASMYDASLDKFKPHEWLFSPIRSKYYYSYNRVSADKSFGNVNFTVTNRNARYYSYPKQYFDQFDWFGFTLTNNYYFRQQYLERLYLSGAIASEASIIKQSNSKGIRKGFISGTIRSSDGTPLPGVNVLIKGTTVGTVTDMTGHYLIEAEKDDQLVFSFIGYSSAEATIGRKNVLDVLLAEDVKQLSEVVVTAFGVQEKQSLAASFSVAMSSDSSAGDFVLKPILQLPEALQGRVAGVQITGIPGGTSKLMIRGTSTISGDAEPMYVVDGVPVEFSSISQDDLATMQLLKGSAATAIYGSRASNGVVIITTKSGQKKLDEELAKVSVRKNFNETAFFFPQLRTDENGKIRFTFTTPESLTRWKLQLLAHNKELVSTTKILQAITQKELMVIPNTPRFLRVGDEIIFSTKISNLTPSEKAGDVALQLYDAVSGKPVDQLFENVIRNQTFKVGGNGNTQVSWRLKIPSTVDAVQYKVIAKAGSFSDGEQNALPILSNKMLVTETLPMYVRSGESKTFTLDKLKNNKSSSLENHVLTLEVTSNPAWYALQSLPYLMEFPYECAEQTFSRFYANTLASNLANSNPKIRDVFDKWASSSALISNLEKNPELKSTIIQETPWIRDAQSEAEQKKRIGLLFDINTMRGQLKQATDKLQEMQLSDGGFTWFKGGHYPSRCITLHVVSGFGHLKHLKIEIDKDLTTMINKAVSFLDEEIYDDYVKLMQQSNDILLKADNRTNGTRLSKEFLDKKTIQNEQIHYLYMRTFFSDIKIPEKCKLAVEYYLKQSTNHWKEINLYLKGMIALIQYRNDSIDVARDILRTLHETSILSNEMGMYWKENAGGYYWSEAPIETQALLIEAFAEIEATDQKISEQDKLKTIDELRIWLLKNKQTSQWRTTKATTEAVYALLLNGTKWLLQDNLVEVSIGNKAVTPEKLQSTPEAGTGYFKTSWKGEGITSAMSEVKLTKKDPGIAWAGLYWQYFEDLDKITSAETPLKLTKKVFIVTKTDKGELLKEVNASVPVEIGALLRVRIELKADRYMEFLHMKDMRAAGLEPVDVLSEYKYQANLGYYQSTKDASTNFFFDDVEKGVYIFEYDLRASNKGDFANGITTIQSMYAPEFGSHSEGSRIKIN